MKEAGGPVFGAGAWACVAGAARSMPSAATANDVVNEAFMAMTYHISMFRVTRAHMSAAICGENENPNQRDDMR